MTEPKKSRRAAAFVLKSWRDFPPLNASQGSMRHNLTGRWRYIKPIYEDKVPACQNACPAGNDIEGWIRLLKAGDLDQAYRLMRREQPFPAILGRVCFKYCEKSCNRSAFDDGIGIRDLERFVADSRPQRAAEPPGTLPENGKRLAVVGSGPAGMAAAYFGRRLGFAVTLIEARPVLGGILRLGIPAYRLPRDTVAAAFDGLKNMGVDLQPGTTVGQDLPIAELAASHDYVFLATGRHVPLRLRIDGERQSPRVMSALEMLSRVATDEAVDVGRQVVVIGGGNTAIDAARTARRLGADVTVVYRRSKAEMPAHPAEVEEAAKEGVRFRYLSAPDRIAVAGDGSIDTLNCSGMTLGDPDTDGRRRPQRLPGRTFALRPDSILTAIGEAPDLAYLGDCAEAGADMIPTDAGLRVEAEVPGGARIYAGGDITARPFSVVHAVAAGKRAAIAMDCHRRGVNSLGVLEKLSIGDGPAVSFARYIDRGKAVPTSAGAAKVVDSSRIVYDYFGKAARVAAGQAPPDERIRSFAPVDIGYDPARAMQEADRCMHCGRCTECDNCLIFCPDMSVLKRGSNAFGYDVDYDYCKGCGICFTECPRHAITMVEETPYPDSEEV